VGGIGAISNGVSYLKWGEAIVDKRAFSRYETLDEFAFPISPPDYRTKQTHHFFQGRRPTSWNIVELIRNGANKSDWGSLREAHVPTFRVFTTWNRIGNLIKKLSKIKKKMKNHII